MNRPGGTRDPQVAHRTPDPHAQSVLTLARAMARTAVVPGLVAVAGGAVTAAVLAGTPGLYGALVGGGLALGSSLATILLMRWSAGLPVMLVMVVALGGFGLKLLVLLGAMVALSGVAALHPLSLALTFLATVLVGAGADVVAFRRTRIPTLILPDRQGPSGDRQGPSGDRQGPSGDR